MKYIKLLFLFTFATASSQEIEPIQTDRPDQTETPWLVPKGMFQAETGFTLQKNDSNSQTNTLPSTLWKYGVNENFELRVITELSINKENDTTVTGINPVLVGCKIKITDEKGWIPKTSLIAHIGLPNAASSKYKLDYFAPEFRFVMQHTLSEAFSFSYNLGAEWNGFSPEPTFIYTVTSGCTITNKWGAYVEFFGFAPQKNIANHSFDGGLTYLINSNFMLDISSGAGITNNAPKHYYAVGFSFRM
jgi:Putative MetA-pathway of phenol degradation